MGTGEMTERIKLPGQWGLRKLKLADRSEWALQFMGMDWLRISEFLPGENRGDDWLDETMQKFADDINEAKR
jgi:hypothetical protein